MKHIISAIIALLIAGCASYSVTESEIQDYLDSRTNFERTIGIKGIAHANIIFNDIKVGIGRIAEDRVNLDAKSQAELMITGQPKQKVEVDISFSATPYYDEDEGAIYLNDLNVESLNVTPDDLGIFANKQLISPIVAIVGQFLSTRPVYRLNENDIKQSLLKTAKPELIIKNHEIVIGL
ncbi:DUF1439 domain-containing protein [Photobacterium sp.]|uniref:DUF1439 domain-containing protein n=1 Tax=Photobacterium sp. TaxID=660 RepID=UPI00299D5009|nr:DUF1439 domain-containing protein [Photobacterium sp.]MDX1302817.1 DUF1439 domain-containing protein [Photobacterium sp.]